MSARPPTDAFHPCLPLDPFAALDLGPWRPAISQHAEPPNAVLILGEPPSADLHPILYSQSLVNSLIVIATHAPPTIPHTPLCAVRILRLSSSLAQDSGALRLVSLLERADRVVRRFRSNDAEWSRKLVQLAENNVTGEFMVEEAYTPCSPSTHRPQQDIPRRYPSPAPSATSSISSSSSTYSSSSVFSAASSPSSFPSRRRRARGPATSSRPPGDRAFDAIINFLPAALPDKILLKHAILVSTLTASFFAAPPAPSPTFHSPPSSYPHPDHKKPKRRSSIFSTLSFSSSDAHVAVAKREDQRPSAAKKNPRRFSSLLLRKQDDSGLVQSAPCSRDELPLISTASSYHKGKYRSHNHLPVQALGPQRRRAHLIHVLPSHVYNPHSMGSVGATIGTSNGRSSKRQQQQHQKQKPKLVQSIEQFLLAFGYPLQSMLLLPSPTSASAPASRRISAASTLSTNFMSASAAMEGEYQEKPIPFLLAAGVCGAVPRSGKMSIGEILLMGGLDGTEGSGVAADAGMGVMAGGMGTGIGEGRVWIGSPEDVVWDDPMSLSISNSPYLSRDDSREAGIHAPAPVAARAHVPVLASPGTSFVQAASRSPSSPVSSPTTSPAGPFTPSGGSTLSPSTVPSAPSPTSSTPAIPTLMVSASAPLTPTRSTKRPLSVDYKKGQGQARLQVKQLPTPPESASSSEDGNDGVDGIMSSASISTSDHGTSTSECTHRPHYTKATATVGKPVKEKKVKGLKLGLGRALKGIGIGRLVGGGGDRA